MELSWSELNQPFSNLYQDRYFAQEDGLAESRYVSLEQNKLHERFASAALTTVGELGFGAGLNFLATWMLWRQTAQPTGQLHYISCEKFPLNHEQIAKTISAWPELSPLCGEFLKKYQILPAGFHRLSFDGGRLQLTLLIGDALESLRHLNAKVDAWYFDGFAPKKNEDMWSAEIFTEAYRLSNPGGTFATYASTGFVQRNLKAAGFKIEKFKGFGRKWEMLKGVAEKSEVAALDRSKPKPSSPSVTIIGAGLSGSSLAESFAKRGAKVRLIESRPQIAQAASGNRAGITLPIFSAAPSLLGSLTHQGLSYLHQFLHETKKDLISSQKPLLQFEREPGQIEKWEKSFKALAVEKSYAEIVDAEFASQIAGIRLNRPALHLKQSSLIDPKAFCQNLLERSSSGLELFLNEEVISVEPQGTEWKIKTSKNEFESDIVIMAQAENITRFSQSSWIPLRRVRGQIIEIESNSVLDKLKATLCFDGYITPKLSSNSHIVGASYDSENLDENIRNEENQTMLRKVQSLIEEFNASSAQIKNARVSFRVSVPGVEPVCGEVCDSEGNTLHNLYILTALSSRGLLYAPLLAEALASKVFDEPSPLQAPLLHQLSAARFVKTVKT